jgi:hypothetical protein
MTYCTGEPVKTVSPSMKKSVPLKQQYPRGIGKLPSRRIESLIVSEKMDAKKKPNTIQLRKAQIFLKKVKKR